MSSEKTRARSAEVTVLPIGDGFCSIQFASKGTEDTLGMNDQAYHWKQLVRNVLYWLSN